MTLVIMAAGMGNRYGGLKQIDPVGEKGEFILDYSIYDAIKAGFDRVIFIIKEENLELFKETVGNRISQKINVEYVFQKIENIPDGIEYPKERTKPWGTAQAVFACKDKINENFAVINADDFYGRESFMLLAEELRNTDKSTNHFCMVGYVLNNTLTENGHVARGVCTVSQAGYLSDVTERTRIERVEGIVKFYEEETGYTEIDPHSIVSLNCWGFTPSILKAIENGLMDFFEKNQNNLMKAEYFLPYVVNDMLTARECDVKVLNTSAQWYGVTYHEDKAKIVEYIKLLTDKGEYPHGLWS